jgi:hypothetical protein
VGIFHFDCMLVWTRNSINRWQTPHHNRRNKPFHQDHFHVPTKDISLVRHMAYANSNARRRLKGPSSQWRLWYSSPLERFQIQSPNRRGRRVEVRVTRETACSLRTANFAVTGQTIEGLQSKFVHVMAHDPQLRLRRVGRWFSISILLQQSLLVPI